MFNKREKVKREYLKYEDGKIKSFEDENTEKELTKELDIKEMKEKTEQKMKEFGFINILKIIGGIALFIFTIYVAVSMYNSFFKDESPTVPNEVAPEQELDNIKNTNDKVSGKYDGTMLGVFNSTNQDLYTQTVNDFARLNDYEKQFLNRIALSNHLNENLIKKQQIYNNFISQEKLFKKSSVSELLYETLLSRINNSIKLSEDVISQLDLSVKRKNLDEITKIYNDKEVVLKENEIILLKKYLDKEGISYTYDNNTKVLKYDY